MSVPVEICASCGYVAFPRRLWCPRCGGREWRPAEARVGVVEEVTTRHRRDEDEIWIGSVRTELGPVCLARVQGPPQPGARVELDVVDGAILARPEST